MSIVYELRQYPTFPHYWLHLYKGDPSGDGDIKIFEDCKIFEFDEIQWQFKDIGHLIYQKGIKYCYLDKDFKQVI